MLRTACFDPRHATPELFRTGWFVESLRLARPHAAALLAARPTCESAGVSAIGGEAQPRVGEGLAYALGAYAVWGLVPIYWRAVGPVPAVEVLAHRIAWSVAFVALLVSVSRGWGRVRSALARKATLRALALSTVLITANWGLFIWAVQTGRLVQASLGYYINPLANVLLGVVLLGERLRRPQWIAVGLAFAGVAYFAFARGVLPWVSLVLAASFGLYGLVRKRAPVEPIVGLFVETLLVAPLAIGYLAWLATHGLPGSGAFGANAFGHATSSSLLLAAAGPVTAIPLVWFAAAAKRLPLSTLGFVQYLSPSLQLLIAVLLFHETLTRAHLVTFGCIWAALALYSFDGLRQARTTRRARGTTLRKRPSVAAGRGCDEIPARWRSRLAEARRRRVHRRR